MANPNRGLRDVRVLELGLAIAAPHCAQILADHGADVIRVEPPGGDRTRWALPHHRGVSLYFAAHNRGKRSVIVDLKSAEGRELFLGLAERSDVIVTNYGADVPGALGIDYETVRERQPAIVYAHITGFGSTGADRDFGAYDGIIQSMSGVPSLTGSGEEPVLVGPFVADHLAAAHAAIGIMAALAARRNDPGSSGSFVDLSMLGAYTTVLAHHVGDAVDNGTEPKTTGNLVPIAFANTFAAADGHVYLAPLSPAAWRAFCLATEMPEWLAAADRQWILREGRAIAEEPVAEWCRTRTRQEIVVALRNVGVPCGPVRTVSENAQDPVLWERGHLIEVDAPVAAGGRGRAEVTVPGPVFGGANDSARGSRRVSEAGEHTREVLAEVCGEPGELDRLLAEGVIEGVPEAQGR
jgi:CoA:oxalate CoA-transferase